MLNDDIKKIQLAISTNTKLSEQERHKLLKLSENLHQELRDLEKTHQEGAQHIAMHTEQILQDATPEALSGLEEMIRKFEVTHPNLTRIVQTLCAQFGV